VKRTSPVTHPVNQNAAVPPLVIETIVETSIYTNDLDAMEAFYSRIMNLNVITKEAGRHVFFSVGPGSVLLIFNPETTIHGHQLPAHGSTGPGHVALGIKADHLDSWRTHLISHSINIEKEHLWPAGGHSIYFRDPAGNSIELITPHVWGTSSGW
jgi:catechol-2,3-dioxygenase